MSTLTSTSSLPLGSFSLQDLQRFNNEVYAQVNGRNFELYSMVCRLSRYNSRVSLRVRQGQAERTGYHLCMMLFWLFALANRLFLNIREDVAAFCDIELPADMPLSELQKIFSARHTDTTLQNASLCLAEKVQGVASSLEYYQETYGKEHLLDMTKRMAQSIEALCVVASILGFRLNEELEKHFSHGCNTCKKIPCVCGFRTDKVM